MNGRALRASILQSSGNRTEVNQGEWDTITTGRRDISKNAPCADQVGIPPGYC